MEKDMRKRDKNKDSSEGSGSGINKLIMNHFYSFKEPDEEYDSDAGSVSDDLIGKSTDTPKEKKKKNIDKEKSDKKDKPAKNKEKLSKEKPEKEGKRKKKDPNAPKRNQVRLYVIIVPNILF